MLETCRPMDIEARSFEIITELLGDRKLDPENALVIKRAIHTTADFDYADNLVFSPHAVQAGLEASIFPAVHSAFASTPLDPNNVIAQRIGQLHGFAVA